MGHGVLKSEEALQQIHFMLLLLCRKKKSPTHTHVLKKKTHTHNKCSVDCSFHISTKGHKLVLAKDSEMHLEILAEIFNFEYKYIAGIRADNPLLLSCSDLGTL